MDGRSTRPATVAARVSGSLPIPLSHTGQPVRQGGASRACPRSVRIEAVPPTTLLLAPMVALVFTSYCFFTAAVPTDPDYWWHLRTGQYIVENGAIPRVEIYSHTAAGRPWVVHEWLTEVALYLVEQRFGYVGNLVLFGLIAAATALAVYATCRLRGVGEMGSTLLMLWASFMAVGSANVRPQAVTVLFLAVTALLLTYYKRGHPRAVWLLPPLLALWVNVHAGYVIGLALLAVTVVGEVLTRLFGRPSAPLRPLLIATALSAAATLLSPHGLEAILYPLSYARAANANLRYVAEWQSPNFHQHDIQLLLFAASLLAAIALGIGRRPLGPAELLWALVPALMALEAYRHIPLYAVVATPLVGARAQAVIPALRRPLSTWRRPALLALIWPVLALALLRMSAGLPASDDLRLGQPAGAASYPSGAVEYLRATNAEGNLFNTYLWGGYLIYELYPEQRVFIDGRADPYGDRLMEDYVEIALLGANWRQVLDQYDLRLVLVEKDAPLAVVLSDDPAWQEIYRGEVELLFIRR